MRNKLFLLSGIAVLAPVAFSTAIAGERIEGEKQKAPVIFATDPGAAHPRNIERDFIGEAAAGASTAGDTGAFDYGAAIRPAATGTPTPLAADNGAPQTDERAGNQGPYPSDPIYRMARAEQDQGPRRSVATAAVHPEQGQAQDGTITITITVAPGDTVFALSRRHGVKPAAIIEANSLPAPYNLEIGQRLAIPQAGAVMAEAQGAETQHNSDRSAAAMPVRAVQTAEQDESAAAEAESLRRDVAYADETLAATYHTVEQGHTLYSISRAYGIEVKALAEANAIEAPYELAIGQELLIPYESGRSAAASASAGSPASGETLQNSAYPVPVGPVQPVYREAGQDRAQDETRDASYSRPPANGGMSRFNWPLQGRIIMSYGMSDDGRRNDGINIAAPVGTPIRSVENGTVVYRGSDLEGYGNLLLIKHDDSWVSAYAHTDAILVKKGDTVRKGQIIAKVGTTGSVDQPQLHFELRRDLKPTDPIAALEGRDDSSAE